ncbi:Hypothetical protein PFR_JS21-2_1567 [Propionibacterium freudenreichii]|nr:Hypothetical protein PFR_JS2_1464 [Propionibacterium freudenreichii]SBN41224.1 Hypothetical protein PFR_JS4_1252 [Propionibacterium freudenreichii]SBN43493.1 Hypothetical protein PFR_J18_1155 [Propionibacterium freudenreichii]SCQ56796.1 Hypothetical protein PFR_JS21-1_1568 [Propionibacterium freudenreichii]SCQ59347.1 Hypothetical protein PFR_JS25-1_1429 [Propionibacterium freudenreichii]
MNHIVGNVARKHAPTQREVDASLPCHCGAAPGHRGSPTPDGLIAAHEDPIALLVVPCPAWHARHRIARQSVTGTPRGALTLSGAGVA